MTKGCLDEAVLQAYLDGELSPERTGEAAQHLAACETCAQALGEAESELAFFSSAFAPDPSVSVPTIPLRARLNLRIAEAEEARAEARKTSGWNFGALVAGLGALFTVAPRRAAVFASLLAVVAFALVFGISNLRPRPDRNVEVAGGDPAPTPPIGEPPVAVAAPVEMAKAGAVRGRDNIQAHRPKPVRRGNGAGTPPATPPQNLTLPGEENYQRIIASLEKVIEVGGEELLKPSVRADYERNVAVVDRAIEQTRSAALRNPKDREALSFVLSAYQSKVELLSTVADRAQVAALGR